MSFSKKFSSHRIKFFLLASFCFARIAYATDATLFLSPVTGTAAIGNTFGIQVMVASGGAPLNAVEGKLSFDPNLLEVVSATTTDSALTSWTTAPSIDNQKGEVTWSGIVSKSITGDRLLLFRLSMKGRRVGEIPLHFETGAAVLAADGSGTNVLTSMNGGIYVVTPKDVLPEKVGGENISSQPAEEHAAGEVLGAATGTTHITSSTYPDPEAWYKERTGVFAWDLPPGVVAVRTSFDKVPKGIPSREYRPAIKEKTIKDIAEGVQYFHLLREYEGGETDIEHRRVAVDATPPGGFSVTIASREDPTDPTVSVLLTATDTLSGIDHFTFALDAASPAEWRDDGTHRYVLSHVPSGEHTLHAAVFDRAGNTVIADENFSVDALPPPEMGLTTTEIKEGEHFTFVGKTIPNGVVKIFVARGGEDPATEEATGDANGAFSFESAFRLSPGTYTYWGEAINVHGAVSQPSVRVTALVNATIWGVVGRHPMIPVAALLLLFLLIGMVFLVRRVRRQGIQEVGEEENKEELLTAASPSRSMHIAGGESKTTDAKIPHATVSGGGVVRLGSFKQ